MIWNKQREPKTHAIFLEDVMKKYFTIFLILISCAANSQDLSIEGQLDCGKWLDARKRNSASVLEHYIIGTVNGVTIGSGLEIWSAGGIRTTRSQLYYWMDAYCTKNPLNDVFPGVIEFVDEKTKGAWKRLSKK